MYINVASDDSRRYDGSCIVTCRQSYLVHILQFSISMFIVQRFRRLFFCGPRPFFATACGFFLLFADYLSVDYLSAACLSAARWLSFCGLRTICVRGLSAACGLFFHDWPTIFLRLVDYLRPAEYLSVARGNHFRDYYFSQI